MLKLDTEAELVALHTGNVKESLYLEYKASDSVDKAKDDKKIEMARDVSAFANSAGGQIIYGMTEKNHDPAGLDQGIDAKIYQPLWFEQVLQQHITPNIGGLAIKPVPLSGGNVAVVIGVPATNGDPHQVSDGRYYRRNNFNRLAMDHYEIKGLFYRTTTPELFVDITLERGDNCSIGYSSQTEVSNPVYLYFRIGNRSVKPAFHTVVQLGIDTDLPVVEANDWVRGVVKGPKNDQQLWLESMMLCPPKLPVFKEVDVTLNAVAITFPSRFLHGATKFKLPVKLITPGFVLQEDWYLHQEGQHLRILHPGHVLLR
jgi:hypothetical protein